MRDDELEILTVDEGVDGAPARSTLLRRLSPRWLLLGIVTSGILIAGLTASAELDVKQWPYATTRRDPTLYEAPRGISLDDVVGELQRVCASGAGKVRLLVADVTPEFERAFSCARVRSPSSVREELVALAVRHNDARVKAQRRDKFYAEIGYPVRGATVSDEMIWEMRADPLGCTRARSARNVAEMMEMGARNDPPETPEEWTVIEAAPIAASCPSKLQRLYEAVAAAGHAEAAERARLRIDALLSELPALGDD